MLRKGPTSSLEGTSQGRGAGQEGARRKPAWDLQVLKEKNERQGCGWVDKLNLPCVFPLGKAQNEAGKSLRGGWEEWFGVEGSTPAVSDGWGLGRPCLEVKGALCYKKGAGCHCPPACGTRRHSEEVSDWPASILVEAGRACNSSLGWSWMQLGLWGK